jgi:hypothetical protein
MEFHFPALTSALEERHFPAAVPLANEVSVLTEYQDGGARPSVRLAALEQGKPLDRAGNLNKISRFFSSWPITDPTTGLRKYQHCNIQILFHNFK